MQAFIDYLGSTFFFGIFVLAFITLTWSISSSINRLNTDVIEQKDMVQFVMVLDRDFNRMGYRNASPDFTAGALDSTQIRFYADIDNNGLIDTLHYFLGATTDLSTTSNPNDRIQAWVEATSSRDFPNGKSKRTFYRRKKEMDGDDE